MNVETKRIRIINKLDDNYVIVDAGRDNINVNDILISSYTIDNYSLNTLRTLGYVVIETRLVVLDTMKNISLCKKYSTTYNGNDQIVLDKNNEVCNHLLNTGTIYHISNSHIIHNYLGGKSEVYKKLSK